MPIFAYHCTACATDFEKLVRNGAPVRCPACDSRKLERRMSLPARVTRGGTSPDAGSLGPPVGGGCCGGACHSHRH